MLCIGEGIWSVCVGRGVACSDGDTGPPRNCCHPRASAGSLPCACGARPASGPGSAPESSHDSSRAAGVRRPCGPGGWALTRTFSQASQQQPDQEHPQRSVPGPGEFEVSVSERSCLASTSVLVPDREPALVRLQTRAGADTPGFVVTSTPAPHVGLGFLMRVLSVGSTWPCGARGVAQPSVTCMRGA